MKKAANNIIATVNGIVFEGLTIEQAQVLAMMGLESKSENKPEKPDLSSFPGFGMSAPSCPLPILYGHL